MPTTRRQSAITNDTASDAAQGAPKRASKERGGEAAEGGLGLKSEPRAKMEEMTAGEEHGRWSGRGSVPVKLQKSETEAAEADLDKIPKKEGEDHKSFYEIGTIERGHIYFFYRPKIELEEAHTIDEVMNFHILLIPRPPGFASTDEQQQTWTKADPDQADEAEMKVLAPGADAVPAPVTQCTAEQKYRLITVGKKRLPDPQSPGSRGRKQTFWATVTSVGHNLHDLAEGLGAYTYETKTRGTRHEAAARLVARGGYAIVNAYPRVPSERKTHLGYHISHPAPSEMGDVQAALGIHSSSSFIIQVKNPLAPSTVPRMGHVKGAEYPGWIMQGIFGTAGGGDTSPTRGRESYGLRFTSCETPELLDYVGTQLVLIAANDGEEGLEASLGEGRGEALIEAEDKEAVMTVDDIFKEIGLDPSIFTCESLEGQWA